MKKLFSVLSIALLLMIASNCSFAQPANQLEVTPAGVPGSGSLYSNWNDAFSDVEAGTHGLTPVILVLGSFTEIAPPATGGVLTKNALFTSVTIKINGAGPYTVTSPATVTSSIITLDGVTFSTINGFMAGGNNIGLTLEYLDLLATRIQGCIQLINGSSDNTIKYVGCKTASVAGRLVYINTSNINGVGNDRNTVDHCLIDGGLRGYQVFGTNVAAPPASFNRDNVFTNNTVKNASALAVFIGTASTGNVCDGNDIFIDRVITLAAVVNYRGINVQAVGNNYVRKNKIHNLTLGPATIAHSYIGIISIPVVPLIAGGPYAAHVDMINNCATLMDDNGLAPFIYAIAPLSTTAPNDNPYSVNCMNNTARVGGVSSATTAGFTVALAIDVETSGSSVNSSNNVCQNERTGGAVGSFHIGYDITAYPFTGVTFDSDYNMCWGKDLTYGWDAGYKGFVYKGGVSQYQDSTCSAPVEQHTMFGEVKFSGGANSCALDLALLGGDMCGEPKSLVTDDINNVVRNPLYPYKGCWEGPALKVLSLTLCLEGKVTGGQVTVGLFTAACVYVADCTADINFTTGKTNLCFGNAVADGVGYRLVVLSKNHLETWSALSNVSFAAGGPPNATYDFTTSAAKAFGGNQTSGPPSCMFGGDVNQDGTIDVTDLGLIDNDGYNFVAGCRIATDVNSDGVTDVTDAGIADNNAYNFVSVMSPCPEPSSHIAKKVSEVKILPVSEIKNSSAINIQ